MTPPAAEEQDNSPAGTAADHALHLNLERLRLITANRDYKRAARRAGQQWRLQHNRED